VGIDDLLAKVGHFNEADVGKLCFGSQFCVTGDQPAAMAAASAPGVIVGYRWKPPAPAPGGTPNADTSITLNGNNPVDWQANTPWQDNATNVRSWTEKTYCSGKRFPQ
jgi:hypothetical protein